MAVSVTVLLFAFSLTSATASGEDGSGNGTSRSPTSMSISPSTFAVDSGDSVTITVTLTFDDNALSGKQIEFKTTEGSLSEDIKTTGPNGKASVTYTAPKTSGPFDTEVIATFPGDANYRKSKNTSSFSYSLYNIRFQPTLSVICASIVYLPLLIVAVLFFTGKLS